MSRITEIKANLEELQEMKRNSSSDKRILQLALILEVTIDENIKEADAMIFELLKLLELVEYNNDYCQGIETKLEDWQNLKKELEDLK